MNPLKAPGPDGLPAPFFQRYWHIVWPKVSRIALDVLNNNKDPGLINNTHIALISKCRLITDNTLVVIECFHWMKKKKGNMGVMALKLDMSKAYNYLEWPFVLVVLTYMGFPASMVNLIHNCISIVSYKESSSEAECIMNILKKELSSGQVVNLDQSEASFSQNVREEDKDMICSRMGVKTMQRHSKYLGLPIMFGRSEKGIYGLVIKRVWKKIKGWKERFLSRAGKEVPIKVVAQAIPSYIMSCYKLSEAICQEIKNMFLSPALNFLWRTRNFLWRLAKNILPTKCNLQKKGIKLDTTCSLCHSAVETTHHLFLHHDFAKHFFFSSILSYCIPDGKGINEWLLKVLNCGDVLSIQVLCSLLHKICSARNVQPYQQKNVDSVIVVKDALEAMVEFNKRNLDYGKKRTPPLILYWSQT
ncbi:hypothetical protein KIW84_061578 [Lathyrus oleraceus]|uniref:Reverse transcriptase zinc-binding domain-containing protein n=1 Tax=Pisum sativum TaxID=3888 RepID=A0A9D4W624_PEA|nr:hypothetical protein KIW84_061578 [Pisum sativum]